MSKYAHAAISEMEAAQDLSWTEMYKILHERAQREDSRSARRAQAWCDAHPEYAEEAPKRARSGRVTNRPAPAVRTPEQELKRARALAADATGAARGSGEWWEAYKATRGEGLADVLALVETIHELANA